MIVSANARESFYLGQRVVELCQTIIRLHFAYVVVSLDLSPAY